MKQVGMKGQAAHLRARDHHAGRVPPLVQLGLDAQSGGGARVPNQGDDSLEGAERTAAPVLRDVAEEPMLDLVPLAGARREMRDVNTQREIIGEALQAVLPGAGPVPITAA